MLGSTAKIHIGEEKKIKGTELFIKLLSFELTGVGDGSENLPHIINFSLKVRVGKRSEVIKFEWAESAPDDKKYFDALGYRIFHIADSSEDFEKEDETGKWVKFTAILLDEIRLEKPRSV